MLAECSNTGTLFLFDRDLGEGFGPDGGILLLKEAVENEKAICGILSNTISRDEEYPAWQTFTKEHEIPSDRFTLISKDHLHTETDTFGFARMLKLTVLNSHCAELAEAVASAVMSTSQIAHSEVRQISIYDFEDIVFRKSHEEGIWEPDTLFRIFGLYQKSKLRQHISGDNRIHSLVKKIRSVVNIRTHEEFSSRPTSWKIQRLEWYEDGADLNSHSIPTSLGDIFEHTVDKRKFVLLAQPCDIMVRSDGTRAFGLTEVFLAEIFDWGGKKAAGVFELKYFSEHDGASYFVHFGKRHAVYIDVLDLCVFRPDGDAFYSKDLPLSEFILPGWKRRFQSLGEKFDDAMKRLTEIPADQREQQASTVLPWSSSQQLFSLMVESNSELRYACRRIGRVASPYADAMLSAFCAHLSRPAFAVDLVGEPQKPPAKPPAKKTPSAKALQAKVPKHVDLYSDIEELKEKESKENYAESEVTNRKTWLIVVSPHGGQIEPHTDLIATKLAGDKFNLILFRGLIPDETECYRRLHVDSRKFRTPSLLKLQDQPESKLTLSVHGLQDPEEGPKEVIWIGGKNNTLRERLSRELADAGFSAVDAIKAKVPGPKGQQDDNFINLKSPGIQLEISRSMRNMLAETSERLDAFVKEMVRVLEEFADENSWGIVEKEKSPDATSESDK